VPANKRTQHNVAACFAVTDLLAAPLLGRKWRVTLDQVTMEVMPKKPAWHVRCTVDVPEGRAVRLV